MTVLGGLDVEHYCTGVGLGEDNAQEEQSDVFQTSTAIMIPIIITTDGHVLPPIIIFEKSIIKRDVFVLLRKVKSLDGERNYSQYTASVNQICVNKQMI